MTRFFQWPDAYKAIEKYRIFNESGWGWRGVYFLFWRQHINDNFNWVQEITNV